MKVFVKGEPELTLGASTFVAEGGEGKVFAVGATGYKIFHDPSHAVPLGKMQELDCIADNNVIRPKAPLYRACKSPAHVGHTFRFVRDTWTLCQLFPRAFREREGLDGPKVLRIVQRMQQAVAAIHKAKVKIVDLNELNVLVDRNFEPYFIDVDSYETPHFRAAALMDSVRDPKVQNNQFTEISDWFSFGIVTFQLFVGIHPFKGKHPTLRTLGERMHANISVFDADVGIPKACYPFDAIPPAYRAWYQALFVAGDRQPPPGSSQVAAVATLAPRALVPDSITIVELRDFGSPIRHVSGPLVHHGDDLSLLAPQNRTYSGVAPRSVSFGFTVTGGTVSACLEQGELVVHDHMRSCRLQPNIAANELMSYGGTLYVRCRDKILEVLLAELGGTLQIGTRVATGVLEHASRLFEGVAIQNLLGEPQVNLFPRSGSCFQVFLPELKHHKVLQAKFDAGVLMVLTARNGKHHRFVFRFSADFTAHDMRHVEDVTLADLNFVTLESGVCVCLTEDEELELFSASPGSSSIRAIRDPALGSDMRLVKDGARVKFYRGSKLFSMQVKQ